MKNEMLDDDMQELYEDAPCGYMSTLLDGTIVRVNQTFLNWTGYTREEILSSKRLPDLLTVPGQMFYETQYAPLLHMQGFIKEVALDLVCKNRNPLPVLVNSNRQVDQTGRSQLIRSTFFDATDRRRYEQDLLRTRRSLEDEISKRTADLTREVSERKSAEDDLRELTSRLLQIRDDERRRLARELHDSVGQMLAALGMNISLVQSESSKLSPAAAAAVADNARWVSEITAEIRTISHLLHPPLLDEAGLVSALTWYIDGLASRAAMKISLELSPDLPRLPQELELAVFRIVQECLTNVHRHSGSKTATVRVLMSKDAVRVDVQDYGCGISPSKSSGVGLRGMRERVKQFAGHLETTSGSAGTTVTARLPLQFSSSRRAG
jgi:PAS domain S-box-containing protein